MPAGQYVAITRAQSTLHLLLSRDDPSPGDVSQVAVDLLTGPGRNPGEGVALLDWMEAHESQWRR